MLEVEWGGDILGARIEVLLYGASAAGEAGARRALEILVDELTRTKRLCGTRAIAEIDRRIIA
ncbi:MAG TPA: alpha-hydroxy-acid oxidizing protein [Casimicrobiaceae bacterium]|nr:alpha-hydroxy-acid oxidizing protein [Casimicrobiaceae bacterium]